METKIIILGDLYPKTIKKVLSLPKNDFCVANLECAITDRNSHILKDGPSLKIPTERIELLKKLNVNLVGLANNHVTDFGRDGLQDTINILKQNNIEYAGCALCENSSIKTINNIRFGFYFVSEHQYNNGVNVLEEKRCLSEIKKLKGEVDFVIVLFHGGKEYYKYPTPLQQLNCHKFVDNGADFVVCQHSHCVGCKETYNHSEIIYGQGNFIFPYSEKEDFKTGIIIQLEFKNIKEYKITLLPTVHLEENVVRFANDEESKKILNGFEKCSEDLLNKSAEFLYDEMITRFGIDFLYRLFNKSKLYIRLDTSRLFKNRMLKRYIKKNQKYLLYLFNYFNCETHIEYIKAILNKQIKQGDNE